LSLVIRHAVGLTEEPIAICQDQEVAYAQVNGVARLVHGELGPMLVGGISSLFLQMLHPSAIAGVAQHSRYQHDPFGRMLQTANFIGYTTYGPASLAEHSIERVLAVHEGVRGVTDDGGAYYANDPELLLWVHCAEIAMFLAGYQRFGKYPLSESEADRYVEEMSKLATDLGIVSPPRTERELYATLHRFAPSLRLTKDAIDARDWLRQRVITKPGQRAIFGVITRSAFALMPSEFQDLLEVRQSRRWHRVVWTPVMALLCRAIRWILPPTPRRHLPSS
jgi:uncharacterized protein (DUF2236 family)